ncbi:metallophosphoesterase [Candidatus Woesearchaeota archaeon]|nr:metallophosphoesterase [Candidatus Woesearchaeota archaeon]
MKILAVSDVHGDKSFIHEMAKKGAEEKVDLVILAGDIVDHKGNIEGLVGPFKAKGLEVAVLPGNHEGLAEMGFLVDKYGAKNLHGCVLKKGDVGIFGCGYADIGIHQLTEQDFFDTLKKAHDSLGKVKKKIMVTHIQPSDSILGLGMFSGSSGVRKALEEFKPDVHICGHIHESHGVEDTIGKTKVINVGKTGKIIEI